MAREDGPFDYFDERTGEAGITANSIRVNPERPGQEPRQHHRNGKVFALESELNK